MDAKNLDKLLQDISKTLSTKSSAKSMAKLPTIIDVREAQTNGPKRVSAYQYCQGTNSLAPKYHSCNDLHESKR